MVGRTGAERHLGRNVQDQHDESSGSRDASLSTLALQRQIELVAQKVDLAALALPNVDDAQEDATRRCHKAVHQRLAMLRRHDVRQHDRANVARGENARQWLHEESLEVAIGEAQQVARAANERHPLVDHVRLRKVGIEVRANQVVQESQQIKVLLVQQVLLHVRAE